MFREIPSLSTICLKLISKSPTNYITEELYLNINNKYINNIKLKDKITQLLINTITDSGRMSDYIIPLIGYSSNLKYLSLKNSKITGIYLIEIIEKCKELNIIDVSGCLMIDDNIVNKLLITCPLLNTIEIRNCRKLTDLSIQYLIEYGKNIIHINIGGNFNITEPGVLQLIKNHPNKHLLQSLNISGLPISENILENLSLHCTSLKYLGIGYAIISEISLRKYLELSGSKLEHLVISWITPPFGYTEDLSPDLLDYISRTCPKLHTLDISGLRNMTYNSILSLVETKRAKVYFFIFLIIYLYY